MKRAAELTLQNGYTHFRLENAQMSQRSQRAAAYATEAGNTLATGYGGAAFATGYSTWHCNADLQSASSTWL
jgi:hypothetical protein